MSKSTHNLLRDQWTERFIAGSNDPERSKKIHDWGVWRNPLNPDSLRLTPSGYKWAVQLCNQTAYKFKPTKPITNGVLLKLERHLTAPYFLENRTTLAVFSEQDALMLELNGHNLEQYLDTLAG